MLATFSFNVHGQVNSLQAFGNAAAGPVASVVSDSALVRAIARGDRLAMEKLYLRHKVSVYRFALRITRNPTVAEDVLSDTFVDVWRYARAFKANSQVSTWLLAIARNKALSTFRRACERLNEEMSDTIEDTTAKPDLALENKDRSAAVLKCLTQLSTVHREVLDLVYYHGKTIEEIAHIVGVPVGTVKTRVHYARQRMHGLLKMQGVECI